MICLLILCLFFFKQKTAYEMRISDWSSDVCSSDLQGFDSLKLDLVMFDRSGVVAKRLAVQAAPLPAGKTRLKVFDVEGHGSEDIGSNLLNDVMDSAHAPATGAGCLAGVAGPERGGGTFIQ